MNSNHNLRQRFRDSMWTNLGEQQRKPIHRQDLIAAALACALGGRWMCPLATGAQPDEPIGNEYRLTISPHHEFWVDLTGFGQFEYRNNPEQDDQAYQAFWPGLAYPVTPGPQLSGGVLTRYTEGTSPSRPTPPPASSPTSPTRRRRASCEASKE